MIDKETANIGIAWLKDRIKDHEDKAKYSRLHADPRNEIYHNACVDAYKITLEFYKKQICVVVTPS